MISLKCKSCGGELEIIEESTVCECEFCGLKQTVPVMDDEKKIKLYERANKLRYNCDFDKALGAYESIVSDFPGEAEAYWGLILCKYGIEYVDDPATSKKVPTCHRSSFESIMDDPDFEMVMENADLISRALYREEAKYIEELRKGIIEISGKEEPYDIFICYKETAESGERTLDSVLAQDIYDELTGKGYRVFFSRISLEDKLGTEYEPYIFAALNSAKIMLAFGTNYDYYNSVWVKNEWSRFLKLMAADKSKHIIPCYKDIDAYDIPKEFAHLQAQDLGKVGAIQDLVRGIEKLIGNKLDSANISEKDSITASSNNSKADALLKRGFISLEDGEFDAADSFFEEVLNEKPECADAYMGKIYAFLKVNDKEGFARYISEAYKNMPPEDKKVEVNYDVIEVVRNEFKYSNGLDDTCMNSLANIYDRATIKINRFILNINAESLESVLASEGENIVKLYKRFIKYADGEAIAKYDVFEMIKDLLEEDIERENEKLHLWDKEKLVNVLHEANIYLDEKISNENAKSEYDERIAQWEKSKEEKENKWKNECEELKKDWPKKCEAAVEEWGHKCKLIDEEYTQLCQKKTADFNQKKNEHNAKIAVYEQEMQKYKDEIARLDKEIQEIDFEIATQAKGIFKIGKKKELEQKRAMLVFDRDGARIPIRPKPFIGGDNNGNLILPPKKEYPAKPVFNAEPELPPMPYIESRPTMEEITGVDINYYLETLLKDVGITIGKVKFSRFEKITFGRYIYAGNDKRPLTWYVLKKDGNNALLITENAIDIVHYYEVEEDREDGNYDDITWETCTLRKWLNNDFIEAAFTEIEAKKIKKTKIKKNEIITTNYKDEITNIEGGNDTLDKVFCLSIDEANALFTTDEERIVGLTPYAFYKKYYRFHYKSDEEYERVKEKREECVSWWLRSPVCHVFVDDHTCEYDAAVVDLDGSISYGLDGGMCIFDRWAVRPALWVDVSDL